MFSGKVRTTISFSVFVAFLAIGPSPTLSQDFTPKLFSIYPPCASVGENVDVIVRGQDTDECRLIFSHPGISAVPKKQAAEEFLPERVLDNQFTISVSKDVPAGIYDAQLVGRFGSSNLRKIAILDGPKIATSSATKKSSALAIDVNQTLYGKSPGNNSHYYSVMLKKGQRVTIQCDTESIDSKMQAAISIFDGAGQELSRSVGRNNGNCSINFSARFDGEIYVAVRDFLFRGGDDYFYTLIVTDQPRIAFAIPNTIPKDGKEHEITLYGTNLRGGILSDYASDNSRLQMTKVKVKAPDQNSMTTLAPLDRTSGYGLNWFPYRMSLGNSNSNWIALFSTDVQVQTESEPNNVADSATKISIPSESCGNIYPKRDVDWYEFESKKGQVFSIDVVAHRLGSEIDCYLEIFKVNKDDKGAVSLQRLHRVDDPGDRNAKIITDFDTSTDDPGLRFTAPSDGTYRVKVADLFASGISDPTQLYRLRIKPVHPSFTIVLRPPLGRPANGNQVVESGLAIRKGSTSRLFVDLYKEDGFNSPVSIDIQGLPPTVKFSKVTTSGGIELILRADDNAAAWHGPIRVIGTATVNNQPMTQHAKTASIVWGTPNKNATPAYFRMVPQLHLSVIDKETSPLLVTATDQLLETSLGGRVEIPIKLTRRSFAEAIKLTKTGDFAPLKVDDLTIPKDKIDGKLIVTVNNKGTAQRIYNFGIAGDVKFKYPRNVDAVTRATAEQKRLQDLLGQWAKMKADADANLAKAKQAFDASNAALAQQTKVFNDSKNQLTHKQQQLATLQKQLKDSQAAAANAPDNKDLKSKVEAKTKEIQALEPQIPPVNVATETARNSVNTLTAKNKTAKMVFDQQTQNATNAKQKVDRLTALKKNADNVLKTAKAVNAVKDHTYKTYSTPIRLKVVASPIKLELPATNVSGKAGEEKKLVVKLSRMYGFGGAVNCTVQMPKEVAGITIAPLSLPADKVDGEMKIVLADKATVGTHACTLIAKSKFNNVDVQTTIAVSIVVAKKE